MKSIRHLDSGTIHQIKSNILIKNPEYDILGNILSRLLCNSLDARCKVAKISMKFYEGREMRVSKLKIIDNGVGIPWITLDCIDTDKYYKGRILNSLIRLCNQVTILSKAKSN